MNSYKTQSTSANSARLIEPVVIQETSTTRKVLVVDINDKKKDIGETVGITFVHQRRNSKEEWITVESTPLSSLKGGETFKLKLDSETTKKLYDELTKIYALVDTEGVQYGVKDFSIANVNDVIKVPKDRKTIIERLLAEDHAEEVWQELICLNPDLATRLSLARVQADRLVALEEFRNNLESKNSNEQFWQAFFVANQWIFGYSLNYQFLHLLNDQPDYGGRDFSGKGSQKGDFLMHTRADTNFTVLIEIKTPATPLLSYHQKQPRVVKAHRNDVWLLSSDILGAISQVQVNARTWTIGSQVAENVRELEKRSIFTVEPKSYLIIGNTIELAGDESIISCFESFRRNIKSPEIITFDELYERAKLIVLNITQTTLEDNSTGNTEEQLPF